MSKVSLVISEYSELPGSGSIYETDTSVEENKHHVTGVVIHDHRTNTDGVRTVSPFIEPVIGVSDVNNLVGKELTFIEATFTDSEQRKAMKDLFTQVIWDWYNDRRENASQPWFREQNKK